MTERAALSRSTGAPDPIIGRVINERFKVTALLARGGMGKVYRAEQAPLGRVCALKILDPHYSGEHDPDFHKRFFLEASVASKLTHPNTVTIFDYGKTDDDIYYIAMEYLEGHTLHRAIREAGHFPEVRVVHVASQICRALREAHSFGVIHRDLKPANIFLLSHGDEIDFVKVLDFGLVKNIADGKDDLTQSGFFMGSPKYMAPEQIRGDRVDGRADLYALGIILYEMITGKVPFDRPNSVNVLMAHLNETAPPLRLSNPLAQASPLLEEIVARCLEKSPDRRFGSMDDLLGALRAVLHSASAMDVAAGAVPGKEDVGAVGRRAYAASGPQAVVARRTSDSVLPAFQVRPPATGWYGEALGDAPTSAGGTLDRPPPWTPRASDAAPVGLRFKVVFLLAVGGALALAAGVAYVASGPSVRSGGAEGPRSASRQEIPAAAGPGAVQATVVPVAEASGRRAGVVAEGDRGLAAAPIAASTTPIAIRVESDPAGATVREDGIERCSSTPCSISYDGPPREHTLTIARQGYRAEVRTATTGSPLHVRLLVASAPARAVVPLPVAPAKDETPTAPNGYKTDIPY